jgi:hypothetical protein
VAAPPDATTALAGYESLDCAGAMPSSRHPRIDDSALVTFTDMRFPTALGLPLPPRWRGPDALDIVKDFYAETASAQTSAR